MGEIGGGRDDEDPREAWATLVDSCESLGLDAIAATLRAGGPPPGGPAGPPPPLILDTDVGGDPDDAIALALAARRVPELALVVTSDERRGDRARLARRLLDRLDRKDVPVVEGVDLGNQRYFVADELLRPSEAPAGTVVIDPSGRALLEAVDALTARGKQALRWVGIGPASNLARVLEARPDLSASLQVTWMGGAVPYRDPERAEHNFRLDPAAARVLLEKATELRLVTGDTTFHPDLAIGAESPIFRWLEERASKEPWAALLVTHFQAWFAKFHATSIQHDALTLSAALRLPFVTLEPVHLLVDDQGKTTLDERGPRIWKSQDADRGLFMAWLGRALAEVGPLFPALAERT